MTQGELYKKIDELSSLKTTNITKKDTANIGPLDFSKKRFTRAIHPIALIEIEKVLDEAKKDLYSTIHDDCYWYNEGGCSEQKWTVYREQPDDCPLRKLEKWFGSEHP